MRIGLTDSLGYPVTSDTFLFDGLHCTLLKLGVPESSTAQVSDYHQCLLFERIIDIQQVCPVWLEISHTHSTGPLIAAIMKPLYKSPSFAVMSTDLQHLVNNQVALQLLLAANVRSLLVKMSGFLQWHNTIYTSVWYTYVGGIQIISLVLVVPSLL